MNFGPLEYATWLQRKGSRPRESARVKAARAAASAAAPLADENVLSVISGPSELVSVGAAPEPVRVVEALATPVVEFGASATIVVHIRRGAPLVLVLSACHSVEWRLELEPGAGLEAVLLAGMGESTIHGAGEVFVTSIGGFYAFREGSIEFRHLEDQVRRHARRAIGSFRSLRSESRFEIGAD